jgi:serine/threonine-protein kinase 11
MQMQRKLKFDNDNDTNEDNNNIDQNMLNNEFYNDDLYDYKDYFMRGREDDDDLNDDDDDDTIGPLAINNLGNHDIKPNNHVQYYNNSDDRLNDDDDYNSDIRFHDLDHHDDMIMETFFKKVDSLELVKPKKAKIISNYLFGELLGDGSYGKVKECLDTRSLCRRAVKIINLKTVSRKIPKGIQNVRKEIFIMKRLDNKNVIKLYDTFEKNANLDNDRLKNADFAARQQVNQVTGIPTTNDSYAIPNMTIEKPPKLYIFMDYCMTNLEKLLKCAPNERLCNWQANFYFKQIIDGLEYLHSIGIIHNDIKPGNLLVTCDDTLKICDFSISAEINLFFDYDFSPNDDDDETNGLNDILNSNLVVNPRKFPIVQCTPMFQCPEMLAESLNEKQIIYNAAKIDVWSSGVTLYQLTTGKLPFSGQTVHQIYENIRSKSYPIFLPEFLDKNLQKLLRGMLNRDPLERLSLHEIRATEWFKKKHPCVREELAQWPVDVLQNETNTFRMLQFLEKLCENESNGTVEASTMNLQNQNEDDDALNLNNNNNYYQTDNSKALVVQPETASKTYAQATKIKRNNCTIN